MTDTTEPRHLRGRIRVIGEDTIEVESKNGSARSPSKSVNGRPPRVSVVIPALNEAENLPAVLAGLPEDIFEVVLVDGASTDGTAEIAREHYPDIRIVGQDRPGKGNALACGFNAVRGDIVVMLDADGSTNPTEIPRFVEALRKGADLAKGSRFLADGGSTDITLFRRLGNKALVGLVNLFYGTHYSDLCYGYNAFWTRCVGQLAIDCDGFEVETLISVRAAKARLAVTEVPSFEELRRFGKSNLHPVRDGARVLRTIVRERPRKAKGQEQLSPTAAPIDVG